MKTLLNSRQKDVFLLFVTEGLGSFQANLSHPTRMLISRIIPSWHSLQSHGSTTRKILVLAGGKGEIQHTKLKDSEKSVCWRERR